MRCGSTPWSFQYASQKKEFWWSGFDLPVELLKKVEAEGRQKVEGCRYTYSVDEAVKTLVFPGLEPFPCLF
jgi:hypothetical protein